MLASMQKISAELDILQRQPHEKPEILKRSEINRSGTALAVRSDVPPMPQAVKTADDVSVYTENLRQLWVADKQLQEAEHSVKQFVARTPRRHSNHKRDKSTRPEFVQHVDRTFAVYRYSDAFSNLADGCLDTASSPAICQ